jgi:hypothetical protein
VSFSKELRFVAKTFSVGEISRAVSNILLNHTTDQKLDAQISERLADGTHSNKGISKASELEAFCDFSGRSLRITLWQKVGDLAGIRIYGYRSEYIDVEISAPNSTLLADILKTLESSLGLTPYSQPELKVNESDTFEGVLRRLEVVEGIVFGPSSRLRCFLSFRFSAESENIALKIQQFLTLLNVQVLSGASYEPRRISDKVLSKLSQQSLDFIAVLITKTGESMWTRDEIASAGSRGIAVIPIVEVGAAFAPGLFGDLEFIEFSPGHIGDSFLKLLQALDFIRSERAGKQLELDAENHHAEPS